MKIGRASLNSSQSIRLRMDRSDLLQPTVNTHKETDLKNLGDLPKALQ